MVKTQSKCDRNSHPPTPPPTTNFLSKSLQFLKQGILQQNVAILLFEVESVKIFA